MNEPLDPAAIIAKHGSVEAVIDAALAVRGPGDGTDPVADLAAVCREAARLAEVRFQRLLQMIERVRRVEAEVARLDERATDNRERAHDSAETPTMQQGYLHRATALTAAVRILRAALADESATTDAAALAGEWERARGPRLSAARVISGDTMTTRIHGQYVFTLTTWDTVTVTVNNNQIDVFPLDGPVVPGSCRSFEDAVNQWVEAWA